MTRLLLLLILSMSANTAYAVDVEAVPLDNLQDFASLIRWSGVFASAVIIGCAWLLLRFLDSVVSNIGDQFVQRRMLLQKLQSFFQFFVYMSTAVSVFMLFWSSPTGHLTL